MNEEYIWTDKKRFAWWPISFTKYKLTRDKLFIEKGLLVTNYEEVILYRIIDCKCTVSIFQRLFGTGSVTLIGLDRTTPVLTLQNIKEPLKVKDAISALAIQNRRNSGLIEMA